MDLDSGASEKPNISNEKLSQNLKGLLNSYKKRPTNFKYPPRIVKKNESGSTETLSTINVSAVEASGISLIPVASQNVPEIIRKTIQMNKIKTKSPLASKTINDPSSSDRNQPQLLKISANEISPVIDKKMTVPSIKGDTATLSKQGAISSIIDASSHSSITIIVESENEDSEKTEDPPYVVPFTSPFRCPVCIMKFEYFSTLEDHLQSSKAKHLYKCEHCQYVFEDYDMYCDHYLHVHNKKRLTCNLCQVIYITYKDFITHLRQHQTMVPIDCDECSKKFFYNGDLMNHKRLCHEFRCKLCKAKYQNEKDLTFHKKNTHYMCKLCTEPFEDDESLEKHESERHVEPRITCHTCEQKFPTYRLLYEHRMEEHINNPPSEGRLCAYCGKIFKKKYFLDKHLLLHDRGNKDNYWPCDQCDKVFEFKNYLYRHQTAMHSQVYNICEICGKIVKYKDKFKLHLMGHQGIKNQECDVCHKRFYSKSTLRHHKRTHTGEKPYECKLCGEHFTVSEQLCIHMRKKHPGCDKTLSCSLCDKKFNSNVHLKYHVKIKHDMIAKM